MTTRPKLTWLGQSGFLLEGAGGRLLIDPYLGMHPDRLVGPPPIELATTDIDALLVTHEHLDHLDIELLPTLLERSPEVCVVVPSPLGDLITPPTPPAQVKAVRVGDVVQIRGWRINVMPAIHALEPSDGYSDGDDGNGARFAGYTVTVDGVSIYHAGDTLLDERVVEAVRTVPPAVCLLPINGRDDERERRGISGNMDAGDAVLFAEQVAASCVIPMHWDLFRGNTADPGEVTRIAAERRSAVNVLIPKRLRPIALPRSCYERACRMDRPASRDKCPPTSHPRENGARTW